MAYFIVPKDDSDFQIEPADLLQNLRVRWPDIKLYNCLTQDYLLCWEIKFGEYWEDGGLQSDKRIITFHDAPESVTTFAIWYRTQIPPNYELFIFHDSDGEEFELLPTTTEEKLSNWLYSR